MLIKPYGSIWCNSKPTAQILQFFRMIEIISYKYLHHIISKPILEAILTDVSQGLK